MAKDAHQPLRRIYLDNAATSWPKPPAVYDAVDDYQRRLGAPAGRSAYAEASEVERMVASARRGVAQLLGAGEPRRIIFTCNGTDSLNLAIHGILSPGDHVVTSVVEHNSVLRPLRELEESAGVEVTRVPCDAAGLIDPAAVRSALRPQTALVAITHASNVTGALQPVAEIGAVVREHGAVYLLDAAQTLGHAPIDVEKLSVDLLAAPGHKGLLAPLGTGLLYVRDGIEEQLRSVRQGGTGSVSEDDHQPNVLPDKYESGNHNVPGLVGLMASVGYLWQRGVGAVREHEAQLTERLLTGLAAAEAIRVFGPREIKQRVGVVSFTVDGYDPQEVAAMFDAGWRVQSRAGLHCAPLAHQALGTLRSGGTVRLSVGPFNTTQDIDTAVQAACELAGAGLTD